MTTKIIVIIGVSIATVVGMCFMGKLVEGKDTEPEKK